MSVVNTKIWLSPPHMSGEEQKYVQEAFATNWIAPLGPNVTLFEQTLENYLENGTNIALLNSGTAAIHMALKLLGISANDTVICQSFTFSASANPITYLGATPIFVDSEKETWNICPDLLQQAIEKGIKAGKKPKAIVAVHLYGMPYQVDKINEIAKFYGIPVIEDSAEALGSSYQNQKCGTFGDMGILSFNGNKIITTSGGGALVTHDPKLKNQAVFLSTQARDDAPHYQHSHIGYNYRMSNVLAGIGVGQMSVLDDRVAKRRANFEFYKENLSSIPEIEFLEEPHKDYFSNRWLTCILTPSYEIRETLRLALTNENIETRPLWKPMHLQPIFEKNPQYTNGTSEDLFNRGLCLPSGSSLSEEDLNRITKLIKGSVFAKKNFTQIN